MPAMTIQQATRQYEAWLAGHIRVVKGDLDAKHELMAQDAFSFLRATFYRWMQLFPALLPEGGGRTQRARCRRFARGELRDLARHRGTAGVGHQ